MNIILNTPFWVWLILILLVILGVRQLKPRKVKLFQPLVAPIIFLPLLVVSILKMPIPLFATFMLVIGIAFGIIVGKLKFKRSALLTKSPTAQSWWQRGSVIPLLMYLYIFIMRYITTALPYFPVPSVPDYLSGILLGLTGIGLGVLLSIVIYREQKKPLLG